MRQPPSGGQIRARKSTWLLSLNSRPFSMPQLGATHGARALRWSANLAASLDSVEIFAAPLARCLQGTEST